MSTPLALTKDYIFTHDLRDATAKIYFAATRALTRHFGEETSLESIDHRSILGWRRKELERGLAKQSWNTYSNHLRTVWGYAIEQGTLLHTSINPFKKTTVIPPKRPSKTVARDAIKGARDWLKSMVAEERYSKKRSAITPAWFWLAVFEMFYYTGIRLNALLTLRYGDVDWDNRIIKVQADTEKTHREFSIPIMPGLEPHILKLLEAAKEIGFAPDDQLFNVNRFSRHYRSTVMNIDQIEGMYRKLTREIGIRMTPHRFRHTLATDLMRQPERNIHLTKSLLNHSNIATTLSYIEVDYDHMRAVLHERSLSQGAIAFERRVDEQMPVPMGQPLPALPEPVALPQPDECMETLVCESDEDKGKECPVHIPTSSESKLLTHVASITSERFTLEQAILPVGTGLSHELTWDGPGTWWEELGIPPASSGDEVSESSLLLTLMINRIGIKSYSWS
ncbi:site-specific integrase [Pseudomonas baetica]|uniref:site-specific integrase n=1 Tax=Pseudomonas baetica TaxID=674054 RepID=UPI002870D40F|nr:site-specific integrase [Pseudomonas baetica]MDR9862464.1 site-specific integrase [Pseudomonas baetica]